MVNALDQTRGPRCQPHYSNSNFCHLGVFSVLCPKVNRSILKVFSPEVYTASFGEAIGPRVLVSISIHSVAISGHFFM